MRTERSDRPRRLPLRRPLGEKAMDAPRLLLVASLLAVTPLRGAHPHSVGGSDGTASWDPPVATMAERERPDPVNAFRYVIDRYKLWPTGSELQVCFFEGDA